MELQRVNVKLFTDAPEQVVLDPFLDIFARWREDAGHPSRWVDLADYAHIPRGPGVMIIGKQGNLALDLADPGPGILYANKENLEGTVEDRILETFRRCLALTAVLTAEPEYPSDLKPRPGFWELSFNDRLETPNTDATDRLLRPAVEATVGRLLGTDHTLIRQTDPQRRYGFVIHSDEVTSLDVLSSKLQYATG